MAKSKKTDLKDKLLKALKVEKPAKDKKEKKKEKAVKEPVFPKLLAKPEKAVKALKSGEKPAKTKAPAATAFSTEEISLRAYYIAERRQAMGWPGDSASDWVEAERQIKAEARKKARG